MPQRGRPRNSATVDTYADTVVPPLTVPWVSGRFYDGQTMILTAYLSGTASATISFFPILVPHPVVVTSIGIETTGSSGAGGVVRLALYDSEPISCMPYSRKIDSGTIAVDVAPGFQSASISVPIHAGWHWLGFAHSTVSPFAGIRTHGNGSTAIGAYQISSADSTQAPPTLFTIANSGNGVALNGYPLYFPSVGTGANAFSIVNSSNQAPRVMIGV